MRYGYVLTLLTHVLNLPDSSYRHVFNGLPDSEVRKLTADMIPLHGVDEICPSLGAGRMNQAAGRDM